MSDPIYRNGGQTHGNVPEWDPGQIGGPWSVCRKGSSKQMNQNDYGLKESKRYFYRKAGAGTEGLAKISSRNGKNSVTTFTFF